MKTTAEEWKKKLYNLHNRTKGISSEHQIDYKNLLKKVFIGKTALDVGCGTCWLKNYLPKETLYVGLDAIQIPEHASHKVIISSIEETWGFMYKYETLFIFAALDGMRNLERAFDKIKEITLKNIVILTGINIEPDLYHTHLITEEFLDSQMDGWKKTVRVQVHPKIIFLEYAK
jgi:hypothetical protein